MNDYLVDGWPDQQPQNRFGTIALFALGLIVGLYLFRK